MKEQNFRLLFLDYFAITYYYMESRNSPIVASFLIKC